MLIITIQVNTTDSWAQTAKESIAYDLERFGDVRVLEIKEVKPPAPKQMIIDEFRAGGERHR